MISCFYYTVEYLLFALGGFLGIVIKVVSKEMKIKIDNIKINLKGNLNPLRFMEKDFSERAGYKDITVYVEIESKEKIKELIKRVEERCPINDNIRNQTDVKIVLK